ncbi:MAG: hypothetical protein ACP5L5_07820 [Vulcanisaeta sp.]|jgi:hypothetical protein|uniref:Uncharacterized protein n=1 Tax=Vulcanisaeta moutnovskia (strain 768-28) TaxID=985053 RepID=F0QWR2_VULM7|nr:hypothetical protein [Vulcanisaeta moutnovskia]ADY02279.1 hypothetical protein VMUT_2082 [Vulcanisaeta moutnovskia 768-28]
MTWNGVHFNLNTIIPWYVILIWILLYFALLAWAWRPKEGRPFGNFKTIDFVYVALIAALLIVYNFFISPLIPKVGTVTTYFYYPIIGEMFLVMLAAALVGKPGSAGLTMFIYTLLSDIIHYGFGGEPFWFLYEVTSYAAIIDLWLIYRGRYYMMPFRGVFKGAIGSKTGDSESVASEELEEELKPAKALFIIDAVLGGITISIAYPFWWRGFWGPFVLGISYTPSFWFITTVASIGAGIVLGLVVAPFIYYIKKVLT